MQGLRIAVTAARKGEQLAEALRRRGAEVLWGPSLGGDEPVADAEVAAATDEVVAAHPDWLVASTGVGMRHWAAAADRTGRGDALRRVAGRARRLARGAKAVGGLAALGLEPEWTSPEETDADVARWLAARLTPGETVAVQLHGGTTTAYDRLATARGRLVTVLPYRSVPPTDPGPARRVLRAVVAGEVDVVTFTSPGAVRGLVSVAESAEEKAALRAALRDRVAVAAVGPVTGQALADIGVTAEVVPRRHRTGDLVRAIATWAEAREPA